MPCNNRKRAATDDGRSRENNQIPREGDNPTWIRRTFSELKRRRVPPIPLPEFRASRILARDNVHPLNSHPTHKTLLLITVSYLQDTNIVDNAETVYISSLALLKMLRHGRAGVPMEVMGLMLGEFVDDYTVRVVDVFAMPQSGTGVSVEAVDPVFQTKMMDMLKQTNR